MPTKKTNGSITPVRSKSTPRVRKSTIAAARPAAPTEVQIAARAYELYVARGGTHGADVEDWLRAESELDSLPVK